jgi:TorA maturation chaperone TorD
MTPHPPAAPPAPPAAPPAPRAAPPIPPAAPAAPPAAPAAPRAAASPSLADAGRWELLRALGAVADSPAAARAVAAALGLDPMTDADHTQAFVLNTPPYAAVYLGPDGALGGEGADRVAGFWRALDLTPPAEPDHLTALLGLHAQLGEAAADASPRTAAVLTQAQAALLHEHLSPWLPSYLDAVTDLALPSLTEWAGLTRRALAAESAAHPAPAQLPLALRAAPPLLASDGNLRDLVDALTTPVRSGMVLTRCRLAAGAGQAAVGHRIGERRYTLRAMLEQDPAATLTWLATETTRWQTRHAARPGPISAWWADRAAATARLLTEAATAAALSAS